MLYKFYLLYCFLNSCGVCVRGLSVAATFQRGPPGTEPDQSAVRVPQPRPRRHVCRAGQLCGLFFVQVCALNRHRVLCSRSPWALGSLGSGHACQPLCRPRACGAEGAAWPQPPLPAYLSAAAASCGAQRPLAGTSLSRPCLPGSVPWVPFTGSVAGIHKSSSPP